MGELSKINGIAKSSLELLEAVGINNLEELAAQDTDTLVDEIERANEILVIDKQTPAKATVAKWIADALELVDKPPVRDKVQPEPVLRIPVNYEADPEVSKMLSRAPCAIPLPGRIMMEKGMAVGDVTAGLLLNRYSGELEVRVDDSPGPASVLSPRRPSGNLETIEMKAGRRHFESSAASQMARSLGNGNRIPRSSDKDDRVSLIRAPREQTNQGKDPLSRSFIRGVLHIFPWRLRTGAVFSLLLVVNLPAANLAAFLLLLSREFPQALPWVPKWFLVFPAALPLVGLGWILWAYPGKCRICLQRLFVYNRAHKHVSAHHIPGIGRLVPLCLHLLAYSWFRCPSCGTPVRLKE